MTIRFALALSLLVSSPCSAQQSTVITPQGVGPVRLCDSLAHVNTFFSSARDIVVTGYGEGVSWPAKVVNSEGSVWILFETGWADTTRIHQISTNSPHYHTRHGYAVGNTVRQLLAKGDSIDIAYDQTALILTIRAESVAFQVDTPAQLAFSRRSRHEANPLALLSRARIIEFGVSSDCVH